MRTLIYTSLVAAAASVKVQQSIYDRIMGELTGQFDADKDGDLSQAEFLDLVTYLNEDQSLGPYEEGLATYLFNTGDRDCVTWLANAYSGAAASGDVTQRDLSRADYDTFGGKLGLTAQELDDLWALSDIDGDGILNNSEQQEFWYETQQQ